MEFVENLIGIDEAGRGTWAGSLFAAAVYFIKEPIYMNELIDSKKTSKENRAKLFKKMSEDENCIIYYTEISAPNIDEKGLQKSNLYAIEKSFLSILEDKYINKKKVKGIADGNFKLGHNIESLVKGDGKIIQIAAASIVAKHLKDVEMANLKILFPEFSFNKHSGYGTKKHKEELLKYGKIKNVHRNSYKPILNINKVYTNYPF